MILIVLVPGDYLPLDLVFAGRLNNDKAKSSLNHNANSGMVMHVAFQLAHSKRSYFPGSLETRWYRLYLVLFSC